MVALPGGLTPGALPLLRDMVQVPELGTLALGRICDPDKQGVGEGRAGPDPVTQVPPRVHTHPPAPRQDGEPGDLFGNCLQVHFCAEWNATESVLAPQKSES